MYRSAPRPHVDVRLLEERFHQGDAHAFLQLAEPHTDTVYTVCLRMTGSAADAEDITQDALVRAIERHHLYRPGSPLRPWLLTIAINLCRGRLRSPWWKRVFAFGPTDEPRTASTVEETTADLDRDRKIRIALSRLPVIYREALSLFYLDDMSYLEMAAITGEGVPALKQRVRRGKEMLARKVEELYPEIVLGHTPLDSEGEAR